MSDYAYERVSTDEQSTARQTHTLAQAGVTFARTFTDGGTSSRISPLDRPDFNALMAVVNPGDTIHISEMFRLVRSVRDLHDVLELLHSRGALLRVHSGAFSSIDLTARDSKGKLRAEVKFLVTCLAAAGEFQRDLQRELTIDGQAAARSAGKHMGRPVSYSEEQGKEVRGYAEGGHSNRAIARMTGLSARTVGRILTDGQVDGSNGEIQGSAAQDSDAVTVAIPGVCTVSIAGGLPDVLRTALESGHKLKRGSGHELHVTASPVVHHALRDHAAAPQSSNDRRAFRKWDDRLTAIPSATADEIHTLLNPIVVAPVVPQQIDEAPAEPLYAVTVPARVLAEFDDVELAFNVALAELDVKPGRSGSAKVTATRAALWDLHAQAWVLGEDEAKTDTPAAYKAYRKWTKDIETAEPIAN